MIAKYAQYTVPGLGALCAVGAVWVAVAARAPMDVEVEADGEVAYEALVPEKLELGNNIPSMEQVVEKHLFVKERKATGANTFPDLVVKGVYVGEKQSVVLSLKSRPQVNFRIWLDDVDGVIGRITDPRDPRRPIVDFLNEWDLKEITMKGVTVEHFVTGEVETYEVDYTPAKHVKDDAAAGYGQGALAQSTQGVAKKTTAAKKQPAPSTTSQAMQQRMQALGQVRSMVQQMTPEQRAQFAERIKNMGGGQNQQNNSPKKSSSSSKKSNAKKSSKAGR